jgi:hypothetical protein
LKGHVVKRLLARLEKAARPRSTRSSKEVDMSQSESCLGRGKEVKGRSRLVESVKSVNYYPHKLHL